MTPLDASGPLGWIVERLVARLTVAGRSNGSSLAHRHSYRVMPQPRPDAKIRSVGQPIGCPCDIPNRKRDGQMATRKSDGWAGMVVFAGSMLLVIGAFNFFEGLIALFKNEQVVVTPNRFVLVDLTSWGWSLIIFGIAMAAVGLGLLATQTWARVAGIIVVGINAVWQITSFGAYPIWSLLMLALDVFVLYALTARWSSARAAIND